MTVADLRPVVEEATAPTGPLEMANPPDPPSNADEGVAPLSAASGTPPGQGDDTANMLASDALSPDMAPDTDHSTARQDASDHEPDGPPTPMDRWEASEDRKLAEDIIAHREQQDILRQQGNEQGAREIEDFISKLPTTDVIKADPQGYLDSLGNDEVAPSVRDAQPGAGDGPASAEPQADTPRPIVIGEQQDRVEYAASMFDAETYPGLSAQDAGLPEDSEELRTAQLQHNEDWINRMREEGRLVIDTGPAEQRKDYPLPTRQSDWPLAPYEVELSAIDNYSNVIRPWEDMTGTPNFPWKYDSSTYQDGYYKPEQDAAAPAASDATAAAGSEAMERWEASEDRILRDNADYFDGEAQRYRDLGDHDAASASQEAGERARSLIGGSAQPNSADTPSPPEDHVDSAGTGNENRTQRMGADSTDTPSSADNPLRDTGTSRAGPDVSPQRDEGTPANDAAASKPEDPDTSDSPSSAEMPGAHPIEAPSALDRDEANVIAVTDLQKDLDLASDKGGTDRAPADWETPTELPQNATIDAGNYQFGTDHLGRVIQATGDLREGKAPRQRQDADHVREMIPSDFDDQAGHLIPAILGGPGDNWNMLPQDRNLNQSEWRIMENEWRNALKEGSSVKVDISLSYHGDDLRPYAFNVEYTTKDRDGKSETVQRDILNAPRAAKDELNPS